MDGRRRHSEIQLLFAFSRRLSSFRFFGAGEAERERRSREAHAMSVIFGDGQWLN